MTSTSIFLRRTPENSSEAGVIPANVDKPEGEQQIHSVYIHVGDDL